MKRTIAGLGALLVVWLMAATGQAHAQQLALKGTIPFEFSVGQQTFPAGEYRIVRVAQHALRITNGKDSYLIQTVAGLDDALTNQADPKLVFEREGECYQLSEIWPGETATPYLVPVAKQGETAGKVQSAGTNLWASVPLGR